MSDKSMKTGGRSAPFENLKNLILILSPSQKSIFRKAIKTWGDKYQYEALYETINQELVKNPDFSFADYLKLPIKKHGVAVKDFNYFANYLCDKILESARNFSQTGKLRRELYDIFENIYFLYGAELFPACCTELEKAKKLAMEADSAIFLAEVNLWERKILHSTAEGFTVEKADFFKKTDKDLLKKIEQSSFFLDLHARVNCERHQKELSQETRKKFEILEKCYLANEYIDDHPKIEALKLINHILSNNNFHPAEATTFAGFELSRPGAFDAQQKLINLLLAHPKYQNEDPTRYWATIANYFSTCFRLGKLDLIDEIEPKLPNDPDSIAFLRYRAYFNLLKWMTQKKFEKAADFIQKSGLLKRLAAQKNRLPHNRFCTLHHLAAVTLFVENKIDQAEAFLDQLARFQTDHSPKNTVSLTSLLHLVVLFEQKRFENSPEFLTSEMRKCRRFLDDVDEMDAFNRKFLLGFEKMAEHAFPKELPEMAEKLWVKLVPLVEMKTDQQPYEILLDWLQARSKNVPIKSITEEKMRKNGPQ